MVVMPRAAVQSAPEARSCQFPARPASCGLGRASRRGSGRLQRLQLVAQAGSLLVRLLANRCLELFLQFTHAARALEPGRILTRNTTDVRRGAVDALEQLACVRAEHVVVLRT